MTELERQLADALRTMSEQYEAQRKELGSVLVSLQEQYETVLLDNERLSAQVKSLSVQVTNLAELVQRYAQL